MIIRAASLPSDPAWEADVIVIGTGSGGAVWAKALAEKGRDVLLLEEGGYFTSADFTQRENEMYPLLYRDGGNQVTADKRVSVLQGSCVGGSTVVNMADVERIPDEVLAHWRGLTGIDEFDPRVFAPFFDEVEGYIGANQIRDEQLNRNALLLKEATEKKGHRGAAMRHNRVGCVGSGYCLIGCAYDAKQSTLITLIPEALKRGARLAAEARVDHLEVTAGRVTAVHGTRVDPRTKKPTGAFTARAKTVVLAAGAVHSPLILMRSGLDQGPVGKNLSLQPQVPSVALFRDEVKAYRGIPQAYYHGEYDVATPEHGLGGFRLESISGGPAMSAVAVGAFGPEHKRFMQRYTQTASSLLLVPDRPGGEVRWKNGRAQIRYALQDEWKAQARKGLRTAAELYLSVGAEMFVLPVTPTSLVTKTEDLARIDALDFGEGTVQTISAHPQGTCRIGTDPQTSVVDPDGRHHAVKNLYVTDASLFPTTASTHTMVPIMATARWLVEKFA